MSQPPSSPGRPIPLAEGMEAAVVVYEEAASRGIPCALCGGIAMQVYGFMRATKDVDFVAARPLDRPSERALNFGGAVYLVPGRDGPVEIDWIMRGDELRELYDAALDDADRARQRIPLVRPDWLVLMKHLAGRGKDHMDLQWLLRQPGLVDRARLLANVRKLMGRHAYWAVRDLENLFLEADLMRARDERDA